MPYPNQRWHPERPTPFQTKAGMLAKATTPAAVARIERLFPEQPVSAPVREPRLGAQSNRRRGTAVEGLHGGRGVAAVLAREGYHVVRSHDSKGAADVIGLRRQDGPTGGAAARAVQAKRLGSFAASGLNDAVRRYLGLGRWRQPWDVGDGVQREAWLWVDGAAWVARIVIHADGRVTGSGPRVKEVIAAIERMLTKER